MRRQYRPLEKDILANLADLSLHHGPVEVQLTEEDDDGNFVQAFIVRSAPDGVLRGLVEDDRIANLNVEFGEMHITPAPAGLDDALGAGPTEDTTEDEAAQEPPRSAADRFMANPWKGLAAAEIIARAKKDPEAMTWAEIEDVGAKGLAPRVFSLGDAKTFTLKDGEQLIARIIDFNHDRREDGRVVPITWELLHPMDKGRPWNEKATNVGGWRDCALRKWLNEDLLALLQDDLKAVIKPVVKKTSAGEESDEVLDTVDTLFIKSEWEMMGRCFYSKPGEGKQYALYKMEGTHWAMKDKDGDEAWPALRSPDASNAASFCGVNSTGTANSGAASNAYGVAFGFCV